MQTDAQYTQHSTSSHRCTGLFKALTRNLLFLSHPCRPFPLPQSGPLNLAKGFRQGCQNSVILHMQNFVQNWVVMQRISKVAKNSKIWQILFCNIARSSALTAAAASANAAKHFGVKVIK